MVFTLSSDEVENVASFEETENVWMYIFLTIGSFRFVGYTHVLVKNTHIIEFNVKRIHSKLESQSAMQSSLNSIQFSAQIRSNNSTNRNINRQSCDSFNEYIELEVWLNNRS